MLDKFERERQKTAVNERPKFTIPKRRAKKPQLEAKAQENHQIL